MGSNSDSRGLSCSPIGSLMYKILCGIVATRSRSQIMDELPTIRELTGHNRVYGEISSQNGTHRPRRPAGSTHSALHIRVRRRAQIVVSKGIELGTAVI